MEEEGRVELVRGKVRSLPIAGPLADGNLALAYRSIPANASDGLQAPLTSNGYTALRHNMQVAHETGIRDSAVLC